MGSGSASSAKPNLAFAKIVATPTPTSWSQVYNAGSLFVIISLSLKEADASGALPALGKKLIGNLEAEFFTLEDKTLATIKEVVTRCLTDIPPGVTLDLSLAYVKQTLLYLVIQGAGRIVMKRAETIGTLLSAEPTDQEASTHTASGYLKPDDIVLLMTPQFVDEVTEEDLTRALDVSIPQDVAETLAPKVHGAENGAASAVVFSFQGITQPVFSEAPAEIEEGLPDQPGSLPSEAERPLPDTEMEPLLNTPRLSLIQKVRSRFPSFKLRSRLTHKRRVTLTIAVAIIIVLTASIYFTKKNEQNKKQRALYEAVYNSAKAKYTEGTGLESLDKSRAHSDFQAAAQTLKSSIGSFPTGSADRQHLQDLLDKVEAELTATQQLHTVSPSKAAAGSAPLLSFAAKQTASGYSEDADNFYFLTGSGVSEEAKSGGSPRVILKNNNDWTDPKALSVYQGNIYILDSAKAVLKFVAGAGGYGKSSYFSGSAPDMSQAVSMSIDGDVWILFKDGTIKQYTKGQEDPFSLQGIDTPLKSPTKIYTTRDLTHLYVLDNDNQRVVKLGKDGTFKAQYQNALFGKAEDLTVSEKDSTVYVLSGGKVYQFTMND